MTDHLQTDESLVEAAAADDAAAFDLLDRRYRDRLVRFLSQRTGNLHSGEELAQQTMVRAFESIRTLKNGERLAPWLYRIAFRLMIDGKRKAARSKEISLFDHSSSETSSISRNQNGIHDGQKPENVLMERERRRNLWDLARKTLSADEFGVVWLRYAEGLTDLEIATVIGKSHGAVRALQHRARRSLANVMGDNDDWIID